MIPAGITISKNGILMFYPDKATLDSCNTIVAVIETNTCHWISMDGKGVKYCGPNLYKKINLFIVLSQTPLWTINLAPHWCGPKFMLWIDAPNFS